MSGSAHWQSLLGAARSEKDVVHIVRDYLMKVAAPELDSLPPACRVLTIDSTEEITEFAVSLAQYEIKTPSEAPGARLLNDMACTFGWAHARIRELRSWAREPR